LSSGLSLLEDRFPWLGKEQDEPVSGADTIDELTKLHQNLIRWRDKDQPNSKAKPR
jgi:hypothetical protein